MNVQKLTPTFFRMALMMAGGTLATVGLSLYELYSGIPPNFPSPYHFIRKLLEGFLGGIFSVWLFFHLSSYHLQETDQCCSPRKEDGSGINVLRNQRALEHE